MRRVAWLMLVGALFLVASYSSWRLELLLRREAFAILENSGVISRSNGLWGQILGRNIPRHPEWIGVGVQMFGALGAAPALGLALVLLERRRLSSVLPPAANVWRLAASFAIAVSVYAIAAAAAEPLVGSRAMDLMYRLGRKLGCDVILLGTLVVGTDGPFVSGTLAPLCNFLWRNASHAATALTAAIPSVIAFRISLRRLLPSALEGACAFCGYDLHGLQGERCPECGVAQETQEGRNPNIHRISCATERGADE